MSMLRPAIDGAALASFCLCLVPAHSADLKVQPAAAGGLVVTNSTGTQERLRVQEAGPLVLPGLAPNPGADRALCTSASNGLIGTCMPTPGAQGPQGAQGPEGPPSSSQCIV